MVPMKKKLLLCFYCLIRISNMSNWQSLGHERSYTENSGIDEERDLLWSDKFLWILPAKQKKNGLIYVYSTNAKKTLQREDQFCWLPRNHELLQQQVSPIWMGK